MQKLTTAIFKSRKCARQAVEDLSRKDGSALDVRVSDSNIWPSLVINESNKALEGLKIGVLLGGMIGALVLGTSAAESMAMTVSGAALLGGGIIGCLIGLRIPQHQVDIFRITTFGQSILLGVYTEDHLQTEEAGNILRANSATKVWVENIQARENYQR